MQKYENFKVHLTRKDSLSVPKNFFTLIFKRLLFVSFMFMFIFTVNIIAEFFFFFNISNSPKQIYLYWDNFANYSTFSSFSKPVNTKFYFVLLLFLLNIKLIQYEFDIDMTPVLCFLIRLLFRLDSRIQANEQDMSFRAKSIVLLYEADKITLNREQPKIF